MGSRGSRGKCPPPTHHPMLGLGMAVPLSSDNWGKMIYMQADRQFGLQKPEIFQQAGASPQTPKLS